MVGRYLKCTIRKHLMVAKSMHDKLSTYVSKGLVSGCWECHVSCVPTSTFAIYQKNGNAQVLWLSNRICPSPARRAVALKKADHLQNPNSTTGRPSRYSCSLNAFLQVRPRQERGPLAGARTEYTSSRGRVRLDGAWLLTCCTMQGTVIWCEDVSSQNRKIFWFSFNNWHL